MSGGQVQRPNLRQVAARAGISVAVVSYVINNGPRRVAPSTRLRVEQAIAELGYRPNSIARALRTQRTETLGLILPDLSKAFFAELAASVEISARLYRQRLLITSSGFDGAREFEQLHALIDARVDGVLIVPAAAPQLPVDAAHAADVPLVVMHRHWDDGESRRLTVVADDREAGRVACRHLVNHGHRSIACLTGPTPGAPVQERTAGVREVIRTEFGAPDNDLFVSCDYEDLAHTAYKATKSLLLARPDVTALCATTDDHALGAMRAIADVGRRVGSDLALVCIDGTKQTEYLTPALTRLRAPINAMGTLSVRTLLDLIAGNTLPPLLPLPMTLITGTTCGCLQPPP
jgi:LacI family transcriptional regulator